MFRAFVCIVIMDCDICCESYEIVEREPKILTQCGHTLCTSCVDALRRISGNDITCPQCRVVTSANEVRTNFAIKGLMEQSGMRKLTMQAPSCKSHPQESVTVLCVPCKQFICKECFETVDALHSAHARVSFKDGVERIRSDMEETHCACERIRIQNEQELSRLHGIHQELSRLNDACVTHFNAVVERFRRELLQVQEELRKREALIKEESAVVVNRLNTSKAIEQLVSNIKTDVQTHISEYIQTKEGLCEAMNYLNSDIKSLDDHFNEVSISGTTDGNARLRAVLPRITLNFPNSYDIFEIDNGALEVHTGSKVPAKRRTLHRKTSNDQLSG